MMGVGLVDAATICATTPARALGLQGLGVLARGAIADLVVLDLATNDRLVVQPRFTGALLLDRGALPETERRFSTVAFTLATHSADAVARWLADRGIFVSCGDFYATTVVQRLGLSDGLVRAGCACYTTSEEVERLIEGVRELRSG